jgi:hypothetical protein
MAEHRLNHFGFGNKETLYSFQWGNQNTQIYTRCLKLSVSQILYYGLTSHAKFCEACDLQHWSTF